MGASAANEVATKQLFEIQPNPFRTETMLRFVVQQPQEVQVTITSAGGRKVASMRTAAHEGLNVMGWRGQSDDGERLAPGVYFVHLQTETSSIVKKVVLQ
jgi:flagellar hook assembly protein FlgD